VTRFDLKLASGRLVTSTGIHPVDIGVREGSIAAIGAWGALADAEEVVDLPERFILPGGIDTHVHGGDPGAFDFGEVSMAAAGIPGIQTMFPLVLREGVKKGRITLPQLARVMSEGPARVAGLYPRKGSTSIGADADFAIIDLEREQAVAVDDQIGVEWTLYEGMQAVYPERVLVRGRSVVLDGKLVGKRGDGEFCVPTANSPADS
jgi:dihydroorotase-like cyclic amidohydrolase